MKRKTETWNRTRFWTPRHIILVSPRKVSMAGVQNDGVGIPSKMDFECVLSKTIYSVISSTGADRAIELEAEELREMLSFHERVTGTQRP
jgi:hypothetical protein